MIYGLMQSVLAGANFDLSHYLWYLNFPQSQLANKNSVEHKIPCIISMATLGYHYKVLIKFDVSENEHLH